MFILATRLLLKGNKGRGYMTLKLQLVRDGKTILEMPLSLLDWPKDQLETEFKAFEDDFERFSNMFDVLSNQTRLKMMRRLVEEEDRTMASALVAVEEHAGNIAAQACIRG